MSFAVPAKSELTKDADVRKILGINTDIQKIPSWDTDAHILEQADPETRLFNPRPFTPHSSKRQKLGATNASNIYSVTLCFQDMTLSTSPDTHYFVPRTKQFFKST